MEKKENEKGEGLKEEEVEMLNVLSGVNPRTRETRWEERREKRRGGPGVPRLTVG